MTKTYSINLLPKAKKDYKKADPQVQKKIKSALHRLQQNPDLAKKLSGDLSPIYSYRFGTPAGEYRIGFTVHNDYILILAVDPRENFYKNLKKRV